MLTKGDLIKLLQDDDQPMDTPINIYLECTNNDKCIPGELIGLIYSKRFKEISLNGTYEEDEY